MIGGLNPEKLKQLSNSALVQAGLPIVLALQQQIEQQLADRLITTTTALDVATKKSTADFSPAKLDQLKKNIGQELEQAFAAASLAAIAELGLLATGQSPTAARVKPELSPELLAGLSETPPTEGPSEAEQPAAATSAAPAGQTEPSAPASESPALGPGGMPTTQTGRTTQQLLQPTAATAPDTTPQGKPEQKEAQNNGPFQYAGTPEQQLQHQLQRKEELETQSAAAQEVRDEVNAIKEKHKPGSTRGYASNQDVSGQPATVDASQEQQAGHDLRAAKRPGTPEATGSRIKRALLSHASKKGKELGEQLRSGNFENFQFILGIAILKDALDYAELFYGDIGITGMLINIFISIILTTALYAQPSTFRKRFIKRYVTQVVLAIMIEFIPVANEFIPTYTIEILVIYFDNMAQQKRGLAALNNLQSLQKRIRKMRMGLNRSTSKSYRKQIDDHSEAGAV